MLILTVWYFIVVYRQTGNRFIPHINTNESQNINAIEYFRNNTRPMGPSKSNIVADSGGSWSQKGGEPLI